MDIDAVQDLMRENGCLECGFVPVDIHHIKSRGSGGKDMPWNLIPLCRKHHTEWHKTGGVAFCKKYSTTGSYLKELGWILFPKLYHFGNR